MCFLFCGYRTWARSIFFQLQEEYPEFTFKWVSTPEQLNDIIDQDISIDGLFFIGWSWIVSKRIVNNYKCICMHPSPLPKYRGGSPLQHQIINNEKKSAVSFFIMTEKIDVGNVVFQHFFSLSGSLNSIFNRIKNYSFQGLKYLILKWDILDTLEIPQVNSKASFFRRRRPEESEIKYTDFEDLNAQDLYNKIRALQDPYPNAYIRCKNNTKLYLKEADHG